MPEGKTVLRREASFWISAGIWPALAEGRFAGAVVDAFAQAFEYPWRVRRESACATAAKGRSRKS